MQAILSDLATADPSEKPGFWYGPSSYWICQGIGWGFILFIKVFGFIVGVGPVTAREFLHTFTLIGSGIFLTHLLRHLIHRQDWRSLPLGRLLRRGFLAAVVIASIMRGMDAIVVVIADRFALAPLPFYGPAWPAWAIVLSDIVFGTIPILGWEAIYFQSHVVRRHRRAEAERWKLEAELATAELGALRAQLNPHFLFNCLNGLRALVVEDSGRAQNVVTRLASVLRYSLQSSSTSTVSLERELQTVDDYLDLEAIRFEERLRVRRAIDPASLRAQVPPMVVQTLVENAIKYGISKYPEPGEIVIASCLTKEEVVVTVTNNGRIEAHPKSTGLGVKNASARLRRLLGRSAAISLAQSAPNLVTAMIRLPVVTDPALTLPVVGPPPTKTTSPAAEPNREPRFWHAPSSYWICQGIGWGIFLCAMGYAAVSGMSPPSLRGFLRQSAYVGSGLLLTHCLRYVILRQDWRSLPLRRLIGRGFLAAVLISASMNGATDVAQLIADHFGLPPRPPGDMPEWRRHLWIIATDTFMILVWEAIYFQAHIVRQLRNTEVARWKLEVALATAELDALKAQLNPHFLFNCLNGLRALVLDDPERSQNVITRLASVLRYSLQSSATPTVSLARELHTVDDYLDLEAIRFEERLQVRREIDPATLNAQVPPMLVQTLVENAIKYGISKYPGPGEIVIASSLTNGEVVITIMNSGQIEPRSESTSLGLKNAADRLDRLVGKSASISLTQSAPNLVTAMIRLPIIQERAPAQSAIA